MFVAFAVKPVVFLELFKMLHLFLCRFFDARLEVIASPVCDGSGRGGATEGPGERRRGIKPLTFQLRAVVTDVPLHGPLVKGKTRSFFATLAVKLEFAHRPVPLREDEGRTARQSSREEERCC